MKALEDYVKEKMHTAGTKAFNKFKKRGFTITKSEFYRNSDYIVCDYFQNSSAAHKTRKVIKEKGKIVKENFDETTMIVKPLSFDIKNLLMIRKRDEEEFLEPSVKMLVAGLSDGKKRRVKLQYIKLDLLFSVNTNTDYNTTTGKLLIDLINLTPDDLLQISFKETKRYIATLGKVVNMQMVFDCKILRA